MELTNLEKKIFLNLCKHFEQNGFNGGCNDYDIENTDENRRFAKEVTKYTQEQNPQGGPFTPFYHFKSIGFPGFVLWDYFKNKIVE